MSLTQAFSTSASPRRRSASSSRSPCRRTPTGEPSSVDARREPSNVRRRQAPLKKTLCRWRELGEDEGRPVAGSCGYSREERSLD